MNKVITESMARDMELRAAIAVRDTEEGEAIDFSKMLAPQASSYGRLTPIQEGILEQYVNGKIVHDIFAGTMFLSHEMLRMGAKAVHAIDEKLAPPENCDPRIVQFPIRVEEYLRRRSGRFTNAFVSWPDIGPTRGIGHLLARFSKVIYLGCNSGGTFCGSAAFWEEVLTREVLEYAPDQKNTLIVYGKKRHFMTRPMMGEETAGHLRQRLMSFEDAEALQYEATTVRGALTAVHRAKETSIAR